VLVADVGPQGVVRGTVVCAVLQWGAERVVVDVKCRMKKLFLLIRNVLESRGT